MRNISLSLFLVLSAAMLAPLLLFMAYAASMLLSTFVIP